MKRRTMNNLVSRCLSVNGGRHAEWVERQIFPPPTLVITRKASRPKRKRRYRRIRRK